jgi:MarR family 2-MHQ and catechol resistance regulon transcriptional repressor
MDEGAKSPKDVSTGAAMDAPAPRAWGDDRERALRLWIALARCYSTFARSISSKVHDYGLTTPQFGILEALYHLGPLTLGDLAGKLLVTGGNVTYVMDRLEEQGLVYRERSPEDRRIIQAKLTQKGHALIAGVFPEHGAFVEDLCGALDTEEQEQLRELLKKLGRSVR